MQMCKLMVLLLLLFAIFPVFAFAQNFPITGFIVDAKSGEPLPVASGVIEDTDMGATANLDGYFVISNVPVGRHIVIFSHLGYHSTSLDVTVTGADREPLRVELKPSRIELATVEVTVKQEETRDLRQTPTVSAVPLDAKLLRTMPSLGGEMDIMRALQTIPGVKSTSDISSALFVRGGSPDQTLILMDYNTVYNPSHMFGLFSTFNSDAVKFLNLIKGGFPAQYGGRSGSVLEVITNDGNRKSYQGLASLGLLSARGAIEGPLSVAGRKGSFAASYRRTYIDLMVDAMRKTSDIDLPDYNFYDGNGKLNLDLTDRTTLTVAGYWGDDQMNFDFGDEDARLNAYMNWGNQTLATRLRHALGKSSYISFGGAYSRFKSKWSFSNEDVIFDRGSERISDWSLKTDYEFMGWQDHQIKTGLWYSYYDTHFYEENEDMVFVDVAPSTFNISWYLQDTWRLSAFYELQPGIRVDPRLAMVYRFEENIRTKLALGRYTQWMNVMSGGAELNVFDIWFPVDRSIKPAYTYQAVLGFEYDRLEGYEFTAETYYTDMHNVAIFRPMVDEGTKGSDAFVLGKGFAYGFEWMAAKKIGRLNGWLGYSLSWTKRRYPMDSHINEGQWFYPKWDRRHDFIAVVNFQKSRRWEYSASWRYNTGQGFTQALGIYTMRMEGFDPNELGHYGRAPYMGSKNNYRFPEDHRLDVSASYNHLFFKKQAKLTLSVFNLYSRRSYWLRMYDTSEKLMKITDAKLLPIVPMINYEVRF